MKGSDEMSNKKKLLRTTFTEEFLEFMKIEAIKRNMHVNELIELAVTELVERSK